MLERWLQNLSFKIGLLGLMLIFTIPVLPYSFPIFKVENLKKYIGFVQAKTGITYNQRWEDGKIYPLPQDIADMHGWEELAEKVSKVYHTLSPQEKEKCMLYGGSYGHAGSINYFRKKYELPETYSLNSSYIFWVEEDIDFEIQIMVDDRKHDSSQWFSNMILADSIQNPNAREKGYIYFRNNPKIDVQKAWKDLVRTEKEDLGL